MTPLDRAKTQTTIPDVAARLFPGWTPATSCKSPFREDRHASFSVYCDGRKWKDHATGAGGDVIDFIVMARGIDKSDAARELIAMAGTGTTGGIRQLPLADNTKPKVEPVTPCTPMPREFRSTWDEGVEYLQASEGIQHAIDRWRSWTPGTARQLVEDRLLACPLNKGKRETAFAVQSPYMDEIGMLSTIDIGFHLRLKPADGERASWRYLPKGITALPFVIGGGFVPYATTIIVTEGQFDAITLASAAGWLSFDAAWPERIAVFGTRGAGGWRPLLDAWGTHWRHDARFVLFPDADDAGAQWTAPGGFRDTLRGKGHRVRTVTLAHQQPARNGGLFCADVAGTRRRDGRRVLGRRADVLAAPALGP